jgi:molybdopterin synthase sulfur carrier subunit
MPKINLIYFGSVTDVTGCPAEPFDAPATLNELNELLHLRYPALLVVRYRLSVNRQLTTENMKLTEGDEIALLPPFAGG